MSQPDTTTTPRLHRHSAEHVGRYMATMAEMKRRFERALPDDLRDELGGLTLTQCEALGFLAENSPAPMHDLARHQRVSMSSCTALVDRLQRQGLVDRADDPSDRRIVRVVPTDRGLRFLRRFSDHKRRVTLSAIGALSPEELDVLITLLTRMLAVDPAVEDPQ
ncbi:MAG TPA: MarR family transcriptional regulator [Candidatus Dormibacteraeota bacterium]|nr:MarR family transcriptional regulator [Candidatus Dormibacteraeota bacterium]